MKKQILVLFLKITSISLAQNIESSTRKFIDNAQFTRINKTGQQSLNLNLELEEKWNFIQLRLSI